MRCLDSGRREQLLRVCVSGACSVTLVRPDLQVVLRDSVNLYYVTFVFNIAVIVDLGLYCKISYTFHNCVINYC